MVESPRELQWHLRDPWNLLKNYKIPHQSLQYSLQKKGAPKKLFHLNNRYLNPFKSLIVPRQIVNKMQVTQWSRDSSGVDNWGDQQK